METVHESVRGDLGSYLFHQGTNFCSQDHLGVHRTPEGYLFRVWAPSASRAFVVGSFNRWQDTIPMTRLTAGGIWEAIVPTSAIVPGDLYKFKLVCPLGTLYKADPYARRTAPPPETASCIPEEEDYVWQDEGWLILRRRSFTPQHIGSRPINVYEVHLGSWMRRSGGGPLTYEALARELIPYVKQMGYTHVGLLPVMEYVTERTGGYQVTGYFAPTARYGTPRDFMAFVDAMHAAGVGVILDWVPSRFPREAHGLICFDGTPIYERTTPEVGGRRGENIHEDAPFDISRPEVQCFLISSAASWAETYHIDGLRIDGVDEILYPDGGEVPSPAGISFFRKLNTMMNTRSPGVMTLADTTRAGCNLTTFADGGLGFSLAWNRGWANDVLSYHATSPASRRTRHRSLTFSMMYSFRERYMLPLSHHEVAAGRGSLLDRMPGDHWQKFAGCRALLGYLMTHPGKKLLFMGCELGLFREWRCDEELEWFLLDFEHHAALQQYVAELNHLYLDTPALHEIDGSWAGFRWIDADNSAQSILSFRRIDERGREVIVVINFTPTAYEHYSVGVPDAGVYEEIFNSDDRRYGGSGVTNEGTLRTRPERLHNLPDTLTFRLPPLGIAMFRCRRRQPRKR